MKKIAIHHRPGSFSDRWILYCEKNSIPYKIVSAFDNDIVQQLQDCEALMWHFHHAVYEDVIAAKNILFALEHAGVNVFPDFKTGWHFDNKVAQKYLLESINAPLVPSYVFYSKQDAVHWAKEATYPSVFKLKGGAGATNVWLVKTRREALRLINKSFGKGFPQFYRLAYFKEKIRLFKSGQGDYLEIIKGCVRLFVLPDFAKKQANEKGYVYFQKFMAGNNHDTRIVVLNGEYLAAEKRMVREGDFRASGSGSYNYDNISREALACALEVAQKLNLMSVAFDFIEDENGKPMIVEMSYGFGTAGISEAPGYWDKQLNWCEGDFSPEDIIIEGVICGISSRGLN